MKRSAQLFSFACVLGLIVCTSACTRSSESVDAAPAPAPAPKAEKSTAQLAIEGATGKTAIEAGQRSKAKLGDINTKRENDLKELDSF